MTYGVPKINLLPITPSVGVRVFRGGPLLDIHGSLQLLNSSHVRERDKGLLRSVMVGCVWNGFLLGRVRNQAVPCRFCGAPDNDGHLFWECTFPPHVEIRENPEFHDLMRMDKAQWPRCLLWHGWLPMLSGCNGVSPWANTASESAHYLVETALGGYSSRLVSDWSPPDGYDPVAVSCIVPDYTNVWTDGSLVLDKVAGISSSGAGLFADHAASFWDVRSWGQVDPFNPVDNFQSCRGFCSVPGPFQSVQRAETWGVILALQSSGAVHLGVDHLGVVRHVGRLLSCWTRPEGGGRWGHYLCYLWGVCWAAQKTACQKCVWNSGFHYFKLKMLALVGRPSLHTNNACMVFWVQGASRRNCRQKQGETSFSPNKVFLSSRNSRVRFWGLVLWYLWIGRANHPGPGSPHHLAVEVLNVGGWLTHGDLALDAKLDFLAVTERRLIPARVRSEWARLKSKGVASIWAPASQDSSHVGNAGVGVVSLRGAPLSLPTFCCCPVQVVLRLW